MDIKAQRSLLRKLVVPCNSIKSTITPTLDKPEKLQVN